MFPILGPIAAMTTNPGPVVAAGAPDVGCFDDFCLALAKLAVTPPTGDGLPPDTPAPPMVSVGDTAGDGPNAITAEPALPHCDDGPDTLPDPVCQFALPMADGDLVWPIPVALKPDVVAWPVQDVAVPTPRVVAPIAADLREPESQDDVSETLSTLEIEQPIRRKLPAHTADSVFDQIAVLPPEMPIPAVIGPVVSVRHLLTAPMAKTPSPEPQKHPQQQAQAKPAQLDAVMAAGAGLAVNTHPPIESSNRPAERGQPLAAVVTMPDAASPQTVKRPEMAEQSVTGQADAATAADLEMGPDLPVSHPPAVAKHPSIAAAHKIFEQSDGQHALRVDPAPEGKAVPTAALPLTVSTSPDLPIDAPAIVHARIVPQPQTDTEWSPTLMPAKDSRPSDSAPFVTPTLAVGGSVQMARVYGADLPNLALLEPARPIKPRNVTTTQEAAPARAEPLFVPASPGVDVAAVPPSVPPVRPVLVQMDRVVLPESRSRQTESDDSDRSQETDTSLIKQDMPPPPALERGEDHAVSVPLPPRKPDVPTTAPAPNLSLTAPEIVPQIRHHLVSQALKEGVVEVTLSPKELGQLRLEIHQSAEGAKITVTAERPETMDLIRRHAHDLLTEFRQAGLPNATLSFGTWSGASAGQDGTGAQGTGAQGTGAQGTGANDAGAGSSGRGGAWAQAQAMMAEDQTDPPTAAYPQRAVQGDGMILRI